MTANAITVTLRLREDGPGPSMFQRLVLATLATNSYLQASTFHKTFFEKYLKESKFSFGRPESERFRDVCLCG
jgi:hypothetical protein